MQLKTKIILIILTISIAYTAGYFTGPTKVEEKIKIEYKEAKKEIKTKIIYRDKITKPDGTVIEKEVEKEDTKTQTDTNFESNQTTVTTKDKGLVLSILSTVNISDLKEKEYHVIGSKRVIGAINITGGLGVTEKGEIKISFGSGWSF
jgi:hypothetical protein